jgi:hypothetical protein
MPYLPTSVKSRRVDVYLLTDLFVRYSVGLCEVFPWKKHSIIRIHPVTRRTLENIILPREEIEGGAAVMGGGCRAPMILIGYRF